MRIGQTSFVAFVSKIVSSAAGFVATIYFAHAVDQDVLGSYFLLLAIVGWLALLGSMGVGSAITKRMSEGENVGQYKLAGGLIIGSLALALSIGLLLGEDLIGRHFGIGAVEFIVLLLVVGLAGSYVDAMLQGAHLVHVYALLRPVRRITRTILQVGGVLLGFGLTALVYGYAMGGVLVVAIGLVYVRGPFRAPEALHFRRLLSYAKYAWMGRLEGKTFNQADVLLLGLFTSAGVVAVYGITWSLAAFLLLFSTSISSALFPEISKLSHEEDFDAVRNLVDRSLAYAGLFTIPGLVGGTLLADRIMLIYGEAYVGGAQILSLLILSVLFYGYQKQFANALGGIDHPEDAFKVNAVLIGSNVVLNVVLISLYGMVGAAVATATSTLLGCVAGYVLLGQHLSVPLPLGQIGRQATAAVAMAAVIVVVDVLTTDYAAFLPNEFHTVGLVFTGAITYFAVLVAVSGDFRTTVSENLPVDIPFIPR